MTEAEKASILLVDDRPQNLVALEALLEGLDLNIVKATSGNEALSLMLEHDFALVLLDVQMPVMDGFETAEVMRSNQRTKNVPIIFVTAISKDQRHVFKGYEAGAVDYLLKPIEPEILTSKVRVFLDLFEQKRALENTTKALEQTVEELKDANLRTLEQQELLNESEARARALLNAPTDAALLIDDQGIIVDLNETTAHRFQKQTDELVGTCVWDLIPQKVAKSRREHVDRVFKSGKPVRFEDERQGKWNDSVVYPVFDAQGNTTKVAVLARDVTERKSLQNRLQRAEKMEVIGTLAGGVAHDLNNILGGIVSYPDLLLMELPEDSPLRKPILTIKKSGQKAAAIVQDLLTLARRGVAVSEVANLNDLITEYLKSPEHEKIVEFHPQIQFVADLETDLLNVLGSPVHLSKSLMNLVSNAAEALPDGGSVVISTKNQHIDRPIGDYDEVIEGDYVTLSVADNGTGIVAADLERIFEPFYTKKVMGRSGTGLGMSVVWGTVKDHKGYVDVQTTEGKGTTFQLYFPVTRKDAEKDKISTSPDGYMGNGETVLVADDVEEQREVASMLLTKLGYSVHTVSNGEEAVEYMKTGSADLVVLDMIMDPGIDGLDTYKKILDLHPGTKAIIASGFSETDRVKEAQRLGARQYLRKPYTLEKVGIAVKAELQG